MPFSPTWVVALVSSGAHVFALGGFGAAGDGGVQDGEAAVARQLVETCGHQRSVRAVIAAPLSQTRAQEKQARSLDCQQGPQLPR